MDMHKGAERFSALKKQKKEVTKTNLKILEELGIPHDNIWGSPETVMSINLKDAQNEFFGYFEVTYLQEKENDSNKWYQPFGRLYLPSGLESDMYLSMYSDKLKKVGNLVLIMKVQGQLILELEKEGKGFTPE